MGRGAVILVWLCLGWVVTALAAMFGSWVITLDPIFSGLAWSFIFGLFASTAFSLVVVPVIFYLQASRRPAAAKYNSSLIR